jgi:hypothetical protein
MPCHHLHHLHTDIHHYFHRAVLGPSSTATQLLQFRAPTAASNQPLFFFDNSIMEVRLFFERPQGRALDRSCEEPPTSSTHRESRSRFWSPGKHLPNISKSHPITKL